LKYLINVKFDSYIKEDADTLMLPTGGKIKEMKRRREECNNDNKRQSSRLRVKVSFVS